MRLFAYTSRHCNPSERLQEDLASILQTAQRNNPARGITGVFFQHGKRFLQFLEGPHEAVEQLVEIIFADPRHDQIQTLLDSSVTHRGCPDWSMGHLELATDITLDETMLRSVVEIYQSNCSVETGIVIEVIKELIPLQAESTVMR